ncbi:hypothetical protein QM007_10560 [Rothia sp. SD9660Na]|uniref:hypothetical protein n=1 Tax=Rothia sp. SD9660Na TaxID=3047030 RepID=UPI0024BB307C|nr:hypothetical protein [Rothia sp. SD9660Na]WHS50339.1 hypothetical protein QM007_10560 [Rothia sp. SD9660Na]
MARPDYGIGPLAHALATDFGYDFEYDAPAEVDGLWLETAELEKTYIDLTGRVFTLLLNIFYIGDERRYGFALFELEDAAEPGSETGADAGEQLVLQEDGLASAADLKARVADVLADSAQLLAEQDAYDLGEAIRTVDATYTPEQQAAILESSQAQKGTSFFA